MMTSLPWQTWMMWGVGMLVGIALLYLLRPRRRRVDVPFAGLWREVLSRAEARRLGRRWRRWLSWLLMSAIAALMLAAMGETHLGLQGCSEPPKVELRHTVLILDASASMQTQDGLPLAQRLAPRSRMAEARDRARALVRTARSGERLLVLSASGRLRARCGWSQDKDVLNRAIAAVVATDGGFDQARAFAAAQDALVGKARPRVVLITDGGPPLEVANSPKNQGISAPVAVAVVGPRRSMDAATDATPGSGAAPATVITTAALAMDNLAVERVSVRARPGDPGRGVLMARLRNDRAEAVTARVEIAASAEAQSAADFQRDSAVRAVRTVVVPPGGTAWLRMDDLDLTVGRFAVRVRPPVGVTWRDRAPWDDWGFAVLAERKRLGVLLVSRGNLFLEAALIANDRYHVIRQQPSEYDPAIRPKNVDVVVLDQVAKPLPDGLPGLTFGLAPPPGAPDTSLHEAGDLVVRDHGHPVMRGVTFHDANLDQVRTLPPQPGDRVLAGERRGGAVLVAREDEVRSLVFGVDLLETDLGARYALPVFMGNAIDWLAGEDHGLLAPLVLGQPFSVSAPVRSRTWSWLRPGRTAAPARLSGDRLVGTTEVQGVHVWRTTAGQTVARPTRLPRSERPSQVQAATALGLTPWRAPTKTAKPPPPATPAWAWLLLAALVLLLLEWGLYHRRRTV